MYSGGWRDGNHRFGDFAILDAAKRLQPCRSNFQVVMLAFKLRLLLLHAIDLITKGVGLGYLSQIQQAEQTCQYNQRNRIADGPERSSLGLKCY